MTIALSKKSAQSASISAAPERWALAEHRMVIKRRAPQWEHRLPWHGAARPIEGSDKMELGIVRESEDDANPVPDNQSWVPLLTGVNSMEIRYFDPRLNAWVDRWTDRGTLPHLVRLTIDRPGSAVPWEAVLPLRRSPL